MMDRGNQGERQEPGRNGGNIAINKLLSETDNLQSPLSGNGICFPDFILQNKVDALLE